MPKKPLEKVVPLRAVGESSKSPLFGPFNSPVLPQGPSNSDINPTGTGAMDNDQPTNPMQTYEIATGPNPDGLRLMGLVAAQGQPGMDHLTDAVINATRVDTPAPKVV